MAKRDVGDRYHKEELCDLETQVHDTAAKAMILACILYMNLQIKIENARYIA